MTSTSVFDHYLRYSSYQHARQISLYVLFYSSLFLILLANWLQLTYYYLVIITYFLIGNDLLFGYDYLMLIGYN